LNNYNIKLTYKIKYLFISLGAYFLFYLMLSLIFSSSSDLLFFGFVSLMGALSILLLINLLQTQLVTRIEIGSEIILHRHFFGMLHCQFSDVEIQFSDVVYEEIKQIEIGSVSLMLTEIKNAEEVEPVFMELYSQNLITAKPVPADKKKAMRNNVFSWLGVAAMIAFVNLVPRAYVSMLVLAMLLFFVVVMLVRIFQDLRR
jgi:hypothetical protein